MRTSTDVRGRRSAGRGDRDGRLRIAALTNGRAVVRVLDSASLRTDAGPSPSGLQGRIYLVQNVSEQDVAHVTPIRRPADGERQSLYFAHAMCTDRDLVAGVARAQLPYAANMVSGVDAAGCARDAGPGTAEAAARLTGMRCEGRGNFD